MGHQWEMADSLFSQVGPSQPGAQRHSKASGSWQHAPPLAQGSEAQACSATGREEVNLREPTSCASQFSTFAGKCRMLTSLAVLARESLRTGAVVLVRPSVRAHASVHARLMAAVIQIWKPQTCHCGMKQSITWEHVANCGGKTDG